MRRTLFTIGGLLIGWLIVGTAAALLFSPLAYSMDASRETEMAATGILIMICLVAGGIVGNLLGRRKHDQSVDAGWFPDPTGRFLHRYWDGNTWTEHVGRDDQQFVDLLDHT